LSQSRDKGKVFVIERNNSIIALLHFYYNSSTVVRVETLAVDKKYQRQGIGKELMLFFLDYCRHKGIHKIRLDAFKESEDFYADLLFKKVKRFTIPCYGEFCEMARSVS